MKETDRLRWFGCGLWTKEDAEFKQYVSFHIVLVKRNKNEANLHFFFGSQAQLITPSKSLLSCFPSVPQIDTSEAALKLL